MAIRVPDEEVLRTDARLTVVALAERLGRSIDAGFKAPLRDAMNEAGERFVQGDLNQSSLGRFSG